MSYADCCDWQKCTQCGLCLSKCPEMEMGKTEARAEIKRLLDGQRPERIMKECTLCMTCNHHCPVGLRPYELILQRISEKPGRKKSLPALVPYFLQGMPGHNFFPDLYATHGKKEKEILQKWAGIPEPSKEVLWIGCIGRMFCKDLENSKVLAELPKFSPQQLCCGELHYRTGQWDAFMDNTHKLMAALNRLETDRLVCYCGSCATYLGKIIPEVAGIEMPFEVTSIYQWLWEKYEQGELTVKNPITFPAAIHESCYVSELGEGFSDTLRKLYQAAGGNFVELEHNRECAMSCGAASIARDFKLSGVIKTQARRFGEVKAAGVNQMALNCPGCYLTLAPQSFVQRVKLRYMPEEILHAFGDEVSAPISRLFPTVAKTLARRLPLALKKTKPENMKIGG